MGATNGVFAKVDRIPPVPHRDALFARHHVAVTKGLELLLEPGLGRRFRRLLAGNVPVPPGRPEDRHRVRRGLPAGRQLRRVRAFAKREVMPGNLRAAELEDFIRNAAVTFWHETCTAKMGRDSMSVVDGNLAVYGIDKLRVADGSIMPRVTTGNTMAPCVVIGERAADPENKTRALVAVVVEAAVLETVTQDTRGGDRRVECDQCGSYQRSMSSKTIKAASIQPRKHCRDRLALEHCEEAS
jgi:hypothetical protein